MSGETNYLFTANICVSCLCNNDENQFCLYGLQTETFKLIFQVDQIVLCYICKRLAQQAEKFIQNVSVNHTLLKNFDLTNSISLVRLKQSLHRPISLTYTHLNSINLDGKDNTSDEDKQVPNLSIKLEPELLLAKDEELNVLEAFKQDDCADDTLTALDTCIKEEDDYPLKLLKEELESEGIRIKCYKKSDTKRRKKKKINDAEESYTSYLAGNLCKESIVECLQISEEQCLEERTQKRLEDDYQNKLYRCDDCVRAFSYKDSFDKHMELHSESKGDYECDICKIRQPTQLRINSHKNKVHLSRYRCRECGLVRNNNKSIEEHYLASHAQGQFMCRFCSKVFKRPGTLKNHVLKTHESREKVICDYCNKSYACKETLKSHVNRKHLNLIPDRRKHLKPHLCQQCGASFATPSQLKIHSRVHSHSKDYYCVECDKNFKTETSLIHHLKTTMSHAKYSELPLQCTHCEKRFAIKRDLERHVNRVHLNIKPFQCDQCAKAYINNWSLKEHQRLAHEGYKRPLRYPCNVCDKVFDADVVVDCHEAFNPQRGHILKEHKRTHTGERPYQCSKCPAQFSQAGVLRTHDKLIHLRLTRDGRPKAQSK